jgi:hypothetical protein
MKCLCLLPLLFTFTLYSPLPSASDALQIDELYVDLIFGPVEL